MAIVKFGVVVVGVRGTIGGATFSAAAAGPYVKTWSRPPNPQTPRQATQRATVGTFAAAWRSITQTNRDDWIAYAALPAQELTNALGEPYYITGANWFTKINLARRDAGQTQLNTPPATPSPGAPIIQTLHFKTDASPTNSRIIFSASSPALNIYNAIYARPWYSQGRSRGYTRPTLLKVSLLSPDEVADQGTDFNGSTQYLRKTTATNFTNSKTGLVFLLFKSDTSGSDRMLYWLGTNVSNPRFLIRQNTAGTIRIGARNAANTNILIWDSTIVPPLDVWHTLLASWDLTDAAKRHVLIDRVVEPGTWTTYTNDTIPWSTTAYSVAATDTTAQYDGAISNLYINPNAYLNVETEANTAKFIRTNLLPENLGADGSTPTGAAPPDYLPNGRTQAGTGAAYTAFNSPASVPAPWYTSTASLEIQSELVARFGEPALGQRLFLSAYGQTIEGRQGPPATAYADASAA